MSPTVRLTVQTPTGPDLRDAFVALTGEQLWETRHAEIRRREAAGPRAGQATRQRHAIELLIEHLRWPAGSPAPQAELRLASLAAEIVLLAARLPSAGRDRLVATLRDAMIGDATLVPVFHLVRTAALQRRRGFAVRFAGWQDDAPFDLLLSRDGAVAELACDTVSAEAGRSVHRDAWLRLADRIEPDLRSWLASHPGRYLLRLTLPQGLRDSPGNRSGEAGLHRRICTMLEQGRRREDDAAAILRLDTLPPTAALLDEQGLLAHLRQSFGPEAQLSVTSAGHDVFAMAAQAGRENDVAAAVRRRMASLASRRLTGTWPGILAMFVEDTDRDEWRSLRDELALEAETRRFLTSPEARPVVAVTYASRFELFGLPEPHAAAGGELRFRNPAHPAARVAALAPAVLAPI